MRRDPAPTDDDPAPGGSSPLPLRLDGLDADAAPDAPARLVDADGRPLSSGTDADAPSDPAATAAATLADDGTLVPPPSREQLLYWLHEAGEIEHALMCCYLYAAFSLKRDDPAWTAAQRDAVGRWRDAIVDVAMQEMGHLALVANLANALGATLGLTRPPFPVDAGPYPAGFVIRLAPFDADTLAHFQYLERAGDADIADAPAFDTGVRYRRAVPPGRLSPGPRDYDTVGELYDVLAQALEQACRARGEAAVFVGDPVLQLDEAAVPLAGVAPVVDLATAQAAIDLIVRQGEGAAHGHPDSHFRRFVGIADELAALQAEDPAFSPAWPAATNPVMNAPLVPTLERVHVDEPQAAAWLDVGNAVYTTALRCLLQAFAEPDRGRRAAWLAASFALMHALVPVAEGLASRPAHAGRDTPHAGLSFTPLRSLALLPAAQAPQRVAERLDELLARARALPTADLAPSDRDRWSGALQRIATQQATLAALPALPATGPSGLPSGT